MYSHIAPVSNLLSRTSGKILGKMSKYECPEQLDSQSRITISPVAVSKFCVSVAHHNIQPEPLTIITEDDDRVSRLVQIRCDLH
jgi:hypothetical protein